MTRTAGQHKYFTLEEANKALPLVRAITEDLSMLARDVMERRERLELLRRNRRKSHQDAYSEELSQIEDDLEKDARQLHAYVGELQALGVEPKNAVMGLVDFPSWHEGRVVYLCWKLGEAEVQHWHELDAGFAGRQPLTAGTAAPGSEA